MKAHWSYLIPGLPDLLAGRVVLGLFLMVGIGAMWLTNPIFAAVTHSVSVAAVISR
jgi:hypothetical protein